jgi:hypothetical protein
MEPRRASDSVADMGTQTEEAQVPEQQNTSLARTRSLERRGQLAQRSVARDVEVIREPEPVVVPQHRDGRGGAPAVRLDMDLDIDIKLQAKIKGEIELSIL